MELFIKGTLNVMLLGVGPEGASLLFRVHDTSGSRLAECGPYTICRGEQLDFEGVELAIVAKLHEPPVRGGEGNEAG